MLLSDMIANMILEQIESSEGDSADIRRNELAGMLGCVPSQINYVISRRFTPEQGYIVESRRGGGGYIRVTRVMLDKSSAIMHLVNSIGTRLDNVAARVVLENLAHRQILTRETAVLMAAAVSDNCYRDIEPERRDLVRASVLKQMLMAVVAS